MKNPVEDEGRQNKWSGGCPSCRRKQKWHDGAKTYINAILESCFLVVTGTASQFGEVYFPLRPLCVFDYNENCCQNDVTASGGPLRVEGLDFLDGQPLSFGNFLIGQLAA